MATPQIVIDNNPTLIFSVGEKYYPCDLFFSGNDVVNNKQKYDQLMPPKRLEDACCYYHITQGRNFTVLQYWYYYANNYYTADNHEHDFECVKVYTDKQTGVPHYLNCNIHSFNKVVALEKGVIPEINVDVGSHAMLPNIEGLKLPLHSWIWHGKKDSAHQTPPFKSMEELRREVMENTYQIMDGDFKIIGDDYDLLGRFSAPKMPWARIEYYIPEESLKDILKKQALRLAAKTKQPLEKQRLLEGKYSTASKGISDFPDLAEASRLLDFQIEKEPPSLEFFLGSKAYAYILKKSGITSIEDLARLKTATIQVKMRKSIKQEKLDIPTPSAKEISRWKQEISQLTF